MIQSEAMTENMAERDTMAEDRTEQGEATETETGQDCGLEDLFARAEELIRQLEDPQLPLEEAFAAYEQGMKVIARCNDRIDAVEKQMLMMNGQGELVPFEVSGGQ